MIWYGRAVGCLLWGFEKKLLALDWICSMSSIKVMHNFPPLDASSNPRHSVFSPLSQHTSIGQEHVRGAQVHGKRPSELRQSSAAHAKAVPNAVAGSSRFQRARQPRQQQSTTEPHWWQRWAANSGIQYVQFSLEFSQQTCHSLPSRQSFGCLLWVPTLDLCSASGSVVLYAISCYNTVKSLI